MSELTPSPEAQAEGVCHTKAECHRMFEAIDPWLKTCAIEALRAFIPEDERKRMSALFEQYGADEWFSHLFDGEIAKLTPEQRGRGYAGMFSPHFTIGMTIRNYLRGKKLGEKELGVHNLDDVYLQILEAAIQETR